MISPANWSALFLIRSILHFAILAPSPSASYTLSASLPAFLSASTDILPHANCSAKIFLIFKSNGDSVHKESESFFRHQSLMLMIFYQLPTLYILSSTCSVALVDFQQSLSPETTIIRDPAYLLESSRMHSFKLLFRHI